MLTHIFKKNNVLTYVVFFIFITLILIHFFNFAGNEVYLIINNDKYYYLAVAQSFINNFTISNIVYTPAEAILNRQVGISIIYSLFLLIVDTYNTTILLSSFTSLILFISSFYPLYILYNSADSGSFFWVIPFLAIVVFQEYYGYISIGITEAYFYPLVIWWTWIAIQWKADKCISLSAILILLSLFLVSLRLQALLVFAAFFGALFLKKHVRDSLIFLAITFSISFFYYFSVQFIIADIPSDQITEPTELRTLQAIFSVSWDDISRLTPVFNLFLFNYGAAGPFSGYFYPLIITPIWIIITLFPLYYFGKGNSIPFVILFSVLLITITLAAFFASNWWRINLRYIYYILPFFFIIYAWILHISYNNNMKYLFTYLALVFTILLIFNFRIYTMYNITNSYTGYENRVESVERHHQLKDLQATYEPDAVYANKTPVRYPRYLFFLTGQSVRDLSDFKHSSLETGNIVWIFHPLNAEIGNSEHQVLETYNYSEHYKFSIIEKVS